MKKIAAVLILVFMGILFFAAFASAQTTVNEPVLNPSNGHYYEAVSGSVTWPEANATAQSMTYKGVNGHLVTITSQAENDFILNNFSDPITLNSYWLGGFQAANSTEPDGGWQWVTGEPIVWYSGIPGNGYGGDQGVHPFGYPEDALNYWDNIGLWNDFPSDIPGAGFIVEYDTELQNPSEVPSPLVIGTVSAGAAVVTGTIALFFNNPTFINRIPLPDPIKKLLQKTISKILDIEQHKKLNPPKSGTFITPKELVAFLASILMTSIVVTYIKGGGYSIFLNSSAMLSLFAAACLSAVIIQFWTLVSDSVSTNACVGSKELNLWKLGSLVYLISGLLMFPFSSPTFTAIYVKEDPKTNGMVSASRTLILMTLAIPLSLMTLTEVDFIVKIGDSGLLTLLVSGASSLLPFKPFSGKKIWTYNKTILLGGLIPVVSLLVAYSLKAIPLWSFAIAGIISVVLVPVALQKLRKTRKHA